MGDEAFLLDISPAAETTGGIFLRRLRRLARLLRLAAEICAAVALITWLCTRVPFAVRASAEILRRASTVIVSPPFVFLLGNAIVGALLSRFRREPPSCGFENGGMLYDELRYQISGESTPPATDPAAEVVVDDIVFQDKEMIVSDRRLTASEDESSNSVVERVVFFDALTDSKQAYRRSRSEIQVLEKEKCMEHDDNDGKTVEKLRRSKSADECRKGSDGFSSSDCSALTTGGKVNEKGEEENTANDDGLSSDEFRRTIENFIARQVKFHRQESMSVVLEGQA